MAVLGNDATLSEQDASQHNVLPNDEMTLQERVEVLEFDRFPGNVLVFGMRFVGGFAFCFHLRGHGVLQISGTDASEQPRSAAKRKTRAGFSRQLPSNSPWKKRKRSG